MTSQPGSHSSQGSVRPKLVGPGFIMSKLFIAAAVLSLIGLAAPENIPENHCHEAGTGVFLTRSAFAHGYRHGYEAGYHEGNIDINMARPARTSFKQFKTVSQGYESSFGPKKSFSAGFELGLKAGYSDGYAGRMFRAVDGMRAVAGSLKDGPDQADANNVYFDRGVSFGYKDGFLQSHTAGGASTAAATSVESVKCVYPNKKNEAPAETSFCDGYRRGFVLGHTDGLVMGPGAGLLEASK